MADHISAVFSSAVVTSLSAVKKKKERQKDAPPSSLAPPSSSQQNEDPPPMNVTRTEDWFTVPTKKSSKHTSATAQHDDVPASKSTLVSNNNNNKFFIPPKSSYAAMTKAEQKKKLETFTEAEQKKKLRTLRKNQRRAARRRAVAAATAQKKTAQKKAATEPVEDSAPATTMTAAGTEDDLSVQLFKESPLLTLPYEVLTDEILSYLRPEEMAKLGACSKYSKAVTEEGFLWQSMFKERFPTSQLTPASMNEWKRAYQFSLSSIVDRLRCFVTQRTFFQDVLGVGVNYTVNPRTKVVDYIDLSQDLLSTTAFQEHRIRADAFGNPFKLFLPLYFSEEHFQRALPQIQKTICRLCSVSAEHAGKNWFEPEMALDVFAKIVNTFVVLLCDEGISACQKSFNGLIRVHRLFLAFAHQYPGIKRAALLRLRKFALHEKHRSKAACPNLGWILPLMMIVDEKDMVWNDVCAKFVAEAFDRSVLWSCKKYPKLAETHAVQGKPESTDKADQRVELTRDAIKVNLRLIMFHAYFHRATSGQGKTTQERANVYDRFFGQPDPEQEKPSTADDDTMASSVSTDNTEASSSAGEKDDKPAAPSAAKLSFSYFRDQINYILVDVTWHRFFSFVGLQCPQSKADMACRLRQHVTNSWKKGYHKKGMDFSRIQASGTSTILAKGQQYNANAGLQRVVFRDFWKYEGDRVKYLDATCILYRGKQRFWTVDYQNRWDDNRAVQHSGDVMTDNGGTHTIDLNLEALDRAITSCVFVVSAWNEATLSDITSSSIAFSDANAGDTSPPLCTYDLDAHDKISYLTSVVMCRLYRTTTVAGERWHVQAIGEAHKGAAGNYGPIYAAIEKLL